MKTTQEIITALEANHLAASLWEKGELSRIYINGVGHNTKKVQQKLWIDAKTLTVHAKTISDQPEAWNESQSKQLIKHHALRLLLAVGRKEELTYVVHDKYDEDVVVGRGKLEEVDHLLLEEDGDQFLDELAVSVEHPDYGRLTTYDMYTEWLDHKEA